MKLSAELVAEPGDLERVRTSKHKVIDIDDEQNDQGFIKKDVQIEMNISKMETKSSQKIVKWGVPSTRRLAQAINGFVKVAYFMFCARLNKTRGLA